MIVLRSLLTLLCAKLACAANCTYPDASNFIEINGLAGYYKQFVINNPVTSLDSSIYSSTSIEASESLRIGQNAITVKNKTADYPTLYNTTGQLSVYIINSTRLRYLVTTVKYTVSACTPSELGNPCRWTAPVVCATSSHTASLQNTAAYMPAVKQKLICAPVMMEWLNNNNDTNVNTTIDLIQNAFNQASNIKWEQELTYGSALATPVTDMPSIYMTNSILHATGRNGKTGSLKYQPVINHCPIGRKPYVFVPRDEQNLELSGLYCYTVFGSGILYPSIVPWISGEKCVNLTAAIVLTRVTGRPTAGLFVVFPPTTSLTNEDNATFWRPVLGLFAENPAQDPILNPQGGTDVNVAMTVIGLCTNSCAAKYFKVYSAINCDILCYAIFDQLIELNAAGALTLPIVKSSCLQLNFTRLVKKFNSSLSEEPQIEYMFYSCEKIIFVYTGVHFNLPKTNPVTQPFDADVVTPNLFPIKIILLAPSNINSLYRGQRCEEILTTTNQTDYPVFSSPVSNGGYTSAACGTTTNLLVSTSTQAATTLMQQLFDREAELLVKATPEILTENALLTVWLQSLQTLVLSLLASAAILTVGSQSGQIDQLFYASMNAITCFNAARFNQYKRPAVWILNSGLVMLLILTNITTYANIAQLTLNSAGNKYYTATKVELVALEDTDFLVESIQTTVYHPKIWPGVAMLVIYSFAIVCMFMWQIWSMCTTKWERRWVWLNEQSWESWDAVNRHRFP